MASRIYNVKNETLAALLVIVLNEQFKNVAFEAVENGSGGYDILVSMKGYNPLIPEALRKRIQLTINVISITYREVKKLFQDQGDPK